MKKAVIIAALISGLAIAATANAGIYVSGNLGQASMSNEALSNLAVESKATKTKGKAAMYTLGVGYNINDYFAFEGRLGGFGKEKGDIANSSETKFNSMYGLYGKAQLPITESFSAYGVLGGTAVSYNDAENANISKSKRKPTASASGGVGVQYNVTESLGVNLEYMNYSSRKKTELSNVALGLQYKF